MKIININESYNHDKGIFFVENRVLVCLEQNNFILPINSTIDTLKLFIRRSYSFEDRLIINSEINYSDDQIQDKGFILIDAKNFLLSTEKNDNNFEIIRAYQWHSWDLKSKYCGRCASILYHIDNTFEKKCQNCNASFFPNLAPVVMVLIYRDNDILLGRPANLKHNLYSVIAGYIDIGETAEMAIKREVLEEVNVEVSNIEYLGSQSWPFPDSFIIAFKAKYLSGEIKADENELSDAKWFNINNLPQIPAKASIARKIIDDFVMARQK